MKVNGNVFPIVLVLLVASIFTSGCATIEGAFSSTKAPPSRTSPNEIYIGMSMRSVERAWGIPGDVETAGGRDAGNQRWVYRDSGISQYGLGTARVIYFENGKVAGWQTTSDTLAQ